MYAPLARAGSGSPCVTRVTGGLSEAKSLLLLMLPLSARPTASPRDVPLAPRAETGPSIPESRLLEVPATYDSVFRVVRAAVRRVLGVERAGLGLALSDLPPGLGAFWQVAGNVIVLNEGLVETMRVRASGPLELNSFVYVILAHEYLHSLGYLDERSVREVTARVTRSAFGAAHPATRMAEGDLWRLFPFLALAPGGQGSRVRIVPRFDLASTETYIR